MKTKTATINGFIVFDAHRAKFPSIYPDGPFTFNTYGPSRECIVVCEHSFAVEVPADFDPRPGMVEALEKKKRHLQAEFSAAVTEINRQISELQAIEYSGEAA